MMNRNRVILFPFLLLLLSACSPDRETEETGIPVGFSSALVSGVDKETDKKSDKEPGRAATPITGELTTANLSSMGVFACYTGQGNWSTSSLPNFMCNQEVHKPGGVWEYSPVKYWPNTQGDRLTFFAYAPHSASAKGITPSGKTVAGYPYLNYTVPAVESEQSDLLASAPLLNKTKGDVLSFTMNHVLTRVRFEARSTSDITITALSVNGGAATGKLTFMGSGAEWNSSLSGSQNFSATANVKVDATSDTHTDATRIAEFFLLPKNAPSITLTFSESGSSETQTVDLPTSPVWEMGKTVVYTLNIENKTEITMSVTENWSTGGANGNMGETPSGSYPYMKNGIIYESATKAYIVGPFRIPVPDASSWGGNTDGWIPWYTAVCMCRGEYAEFGYEKGQWRLPTKNELENIFRKDLGKSTLWAITETSASNAYRCTSYNGFSYYDTPKTDMTPGGRLLCVRDVGTEMVYPTMRRDANGFPCIYFSASNIIMKSKLTNNHPDFVTYSVAQSTCASLNEGGYTNWRLPTKTELKTIAELGMFSSTFWAQDYKLTWGANPNRGGGLHEYNAADGGEARVVCVRDY